MSRIRYNYFVKQKRHQDVKYYSPFDHPLIAFLSEHWVALLIITFLIFLSYINAWGNDFVSDDIEGILLNKNIDNLSYIFSLKLAFFRPLLYYVLFEIGGRDAVLFRTVNIVAHWGSTIVFYLIVSKFSEKRIGILSAVLFAVHPILVESVTWISAGSYVISAFFFLLSLWFFITRHDCKKRYILSIIFFILATLNSEKTTILPLILITYLLSFEKITPKWKVVLPYFIITGLWAVWYFFLIKERIVIQQTVYYQQKGFDNPLIQVPAAISSYLELLFWPDKLSIYQSELHYTPWEFGIRAAITVLFFSVILVAFKKNKYIFFWLSFMVITLIPTLLPLKIAWVVAERYIYLGTTGIIAVIAYCAFRFKPKISQTLFYGVVVFVVVSLTIRTIVRNNDWKNEDNLFIATGRTAPSDFKTHNNLGWVYQKNGDYKKALKEFKKAIDINPYYIEGHNNTGLTYMQMGDYKNAALYFEKTIQLNPRYVSAYASLGTILIKVKQYDQAEKYLLKSIKLQPDFTPSYHNLGKLYELQDKNEQAIKMYEKALIIDPNTWQSHMNLGSVYYSLKDYQKAETYTKKAQELNPNNAELFISLSKIYMKLDKKQQARDALYNAIRIDPQNTEVQELLKNL